MNVIPVSALHENFLAGGLKRSTEQMSVLGRSQQIEAARENKMPKLRKMMMMAISCTRISLMILYQLTWRLCCQLRMLSQTKQGSYAAKMRTWSLCSTLLTSLFLLFKKLDVERNP
jgi:hypothetical protein